MARAAQLGDFHALHPVSWSRSSRKAPPTIRASSEPTSSPKFRSPSSCARRRCS
jgi:hypothetical protein